MLAVSVRLKSYDTLIWEGVKRPLDDAFDLNSPLKNPFGPCNYGKVYICILFQCGGVRIGLNAGFF